MINLKSKTRVPFVAQLQLADCGIACVAMILRYYKSYQSMNDLRGFFEIGRDGIAVRQINQLLNKLNFTTKIYKIPTQNIDLISFPAIVFWEEKHFVVLEKIKKGTFYIVDPGYGRKQLSKEKFTESYSGLVIYAVPNDSFIRVKKKDNVFKNFSSVILKNKLLYVKLLIFSLISYTLTIAAPIIIKSTIDAITSGGDKIYTNKLFVCLFCLFLFLAFMEFIRNNYLLKLKLVIDKTLNFKIISHLIKLPYKFFDVRNKADILFTINNSYMVRETFAGNIIKGIIDIGSVTFILIYIANSSIILAAAAFLLLIMNFSLILKTRKKVSENAKSLFIEENKLQAFQIENVNAMLSLKMSGLESNFLDNWSHKFGVYLEKLQNKDRYNNRLGFWFSFLHFISPIIILYISVTLMMANNLTIGQVVAFYSLSGTLFTFCSSLSTAVISYIQCKLILERLDDIIKQEPEPTPQYPIKCELNGNIKLENVSFSYTNNAPVVLDNINLSIKKGKKVAIVGKSGSGKSTLAKLIVGLYTPTKGTIFFNGIDINKLDKMHIRKQMGVVPQDTFLFNKSILENIVMNDNNISIDEVEKVCSLTQIDEEIQNMPMKYNTIVSEYGQNLSGGQRQRIILARAILHKPKLLLFDEATSALDNFNEKKISDLLDTIGCTRIIVAHRLSTIVDCDQIIVLEKGQIKGIGSHNDLLEKNLYYRSLYNGTDATIDESFINIFKSEVMV